MVVNLVEPLVYFAPGAGDNLRVIRETMQAVAQEAGSADLAALETEIERLDREIDAAVYELYGLTPEEIKLVEGKIKWRLSILQCSARPLRLAAMNSRATDPPESLPVFSSMSLRMRC